MYVGRISKSQPPQRLAIQLTIYILNICQFLTQIERIARKICPIDDLTLSAASRPWDDDVGVAETEEIALAVAFSWSSAASCMCGLVLDVRAGAYCPEES